MATQGQEPETKPATPSSTVSRPVDEPQVAVSKAINALSQAQREILQDMGEGAVVERVSLETRDTAVQSEAEAEAWALAETFDARLTEAEKRIDRIFARLGIE